MLAIASHADILLARHVIYVGERERRVELTRAEREFHDTARPILLKRLLRRLLVMRLVVDCEQSFNFFEDCRVRAIPKYRTHKVLITYITRALIGRLTILSKLIRYQVSGRYVVKKN